MTDGQEINILKLENASLKKKTLLVESELAIIKGIGNNSPEMKSLKSEVEALKQQLHTERESLKKEADELMMKKIEHYEKEIALVREDAQIQILATEKVQKDLRELLRETVKELSDAKDLNKSHQKLNGELRKEYNALKTANQNLRTKVEQYQDKAAHYRRKAVL